MKNLPELFRDELKPGEKLLWTGRPRQGIILRRADWLLVPFSLAWCIFVIYWEKTVISNSATSGIWLVGIPFILVGLYLLVGRFFLDQARRASLFYALTNERAIIITGQEKKRIRTVVIRQEPQINTTRQGGGRGTITFGPLHPLAWVVTASGVPDTGNYNIPPAFDSLEDVKTVYQIVKRLQKEKS